MTDTTQRIALRGDGAGHRSDDDHRAPARPTDHRNAATAAGGGHPSDDDQPDYAPATSTAADGGTERGGATAPAPCLAEGRLNCDAQCRHALRETADAIRELQARRRALIRVTTAQRNRAGGMARRALGWRYDLPEAERARLNRAAGRLVTAIERGAPPPDGAGDAAAAIGPDIEVTLAAIAPIEAHRRGIERAMERLARAFPAHALVEATRGFSARGLAVIIGEAGLPTDYATVSKLWRRLGLAPRDGRAMSTWRRLGGLSAEDWVDAGYDGARLAQIFGVVTEPLMKANDGTYRAVYLREKARFTEAGKAARPAHAHAHAMRLMTKALIRDVWRAERGLPHRRHEAVEAGPEAPAGAG